jgi:hypothetical protein
MSKVLIQLANESFLLSPETAQKEQAIVPSDRYVTTTTVRDVPDHPLLGQGQRPGVFERARHRHQDEDQLTDREKEVAQRWANHLTKSQQRQQPKLSK